MIMKRTECPKCLGTGEYYNMYLNDVGICSLCKGEGIVTEKLADLYDPIGDELNEFNGFNEEDD